MMGGDWLAMGAVKFRGKLKGERGERKVLRKEERRERG